MTALELAQQHLTDVLADRRSPYDLDRENPFASIVRELLHDLTSTRDEFERDAAYAKRELDRALPFVRGESASWNSLGILQSTGTRIEQHAALFRKQADYAKSVLVDYYAYGEESVDAATSPSTRDLFEAAETIETFAGIDEGENTDYDALLALAKRLRGGAEESR